MQTNEKTFCEISDFLDREIQIKQIKNFWEISGKFLGTHKANKQKINTNQTNEKIIQIKQMKKKVTKK